MDFSRFFLIILARQKLILFTLIVTILTTLVVSLLLPKSYKSTATLVLTYKGADPVTGMVSPAQLNSGYLATQLDVIKSTRIALMVVDQLRLDQNDVVRRQFEESGSNLGLREWLAALLLKNLEIETSRDSSVIGIGYKGADPAFTSIIANAFANAYQEISIRLTVEPSQKAAAYFTDQLNLLRERLETAQKKLTEYQQEAGIIDADVRLDIETKRLNDLSSQLVFAQAELMGTASEQDIKRRGGETNNIAKNAMISNLKLSLSQAESRFSEVSQKLGHNHPSYAGAKAEMEKLRAELNKHIRTTTDSAVSQEREIRAALEEQKAKALALNQARNELYLHFKEVEGAQQAYNNAMQRLNQTSLEGQANLSSVSILDTAKIPDKADSPKLLLNVVLSVILGTLLGLGMGLLAEMIDGVGLFAANLAVVFSQLGERTLLIDANLRCPQQHEIFNLRNRQGLSDVLAGRANISEVEVIAKIDSFIDLPVLPAGTLPPNPLELLNRSLFDELNDQLANQFDVILYDTLAVSSGADALAIAARTDGVLVVAHKNNTRLSDINMINEQLKYSGAEVVGSVLIDF